MPTIVNPKLDFTSLEARPFIVLAPKNTMILEVDNLLLGWPTYMVDYTPNEPGPIVSIFFSTLSLMVQIHTENYTETQKC